MIKIINGDSRQVLKQLSAESFNCCVTSPPYWGLRDYGIAGQLGLEKTLEEYVEKMVEIFREVRRVLKKDGTLWLNLGDSYANSGTGGYGATGGRDKSTLQSQMPPIDITPVMRIIPKGLKPKDLCMIPARVAIALQADGWYLRSDIIWSKPNPMPESVKDRPTTAHEHIFLLSRQQKYYYDADSIKTDILPHSPNKSHFSDGSKKEVMIRQRGRKGYKHRGPGDKKLSGHSGNFDVNGNIIGGGKANKRTVWEVPTCPFPEAHFATFPPNLIKPCILAGCPIGGYVLDPFGGSGTTALVSDRLNRNCTLIEINKEYCNMAENRIRKDCPMFVEIERL